MWDLTKHVPVYPENEVVKEVVEFFQAWEAAQKACISARGEEAALDITALRTALCAADHGLQNGALPCM